MFIRMPPSKFKIRNVSINALKLIYVICYENPNFQDCVIEYDSEKFVNVGIAYAMRDYFQTPEISASECCCFNSGLSIKYYLRKIACGFFGALVNDDVYYKFDESVKALDQFFKVNRSSYNLLLFYTFCYYAIGSFCPYYFTNREGKLREKGWGVSWISHYIYAVFAFATFISEFYLYISTLRKIFHLAPPLKMSVGQGCIPNLINYIKRKIINFRWFNYQYVLFGQVLLLS